MLYFAVHVAVKHYMIVKHISASTDGEGGWPVEMGFAGPEMTSHKTTQRVEENLEEHSQTTCILRKINV